MAPDDTPLTRLALQASSVAEDLGFVALVDLSRVLAELDASSRIIGGHMVTALAARWQLGPAFTARPATSTSASHQSSRATPP